jgi:hypothetical protein
VIVIGIREVVILQRARAARAVLKFPHDVKLLLSRHDLIKTFPEFFFGWNWMIL